MSQIIVTAAETFGPFSTVETLEDRYLCDGELGLQFVVIGDATVQDAEGFSQPISADEIAARKAAIQAQIDDLERSTLENRGSRELHMREMEREASAEAAALSTVDNPITADQVLAAVPYYVKLKALNDQIAALRAQL